MRRVAIFVVDGMFDTGLATVTDTLALANELAPEVGIEVPFELMRVGVRRRVRTAHGLLVATAASERALEADVVLVPALGAKTPSALDDALRRRDVGDTAALLQDAHEEGAIIAAACTGTYVLASSGVLNGRSATTTWWLAGDFRTRFPEVRLEESAMVVEDQKCLTAGAALAHVDLALWLVRRVSPELAHIAARYLVIEGRPSQASYAMVDHLAHADPVVDRFERWARRHLKEFNLGDAARAAGASQRTLQRRMRRALGVSPIAYVRALRVERATHLLRTTDATLDAIAEAVGYTEAVTLRTMLREATGKSIRQLRTHPT